MRLKRVRFEHRLQQYQSLRQQKRVEKKEGEDNIVLVDEEIADDVERGV